MNNVYPFVSKSVAPLWSPKRGVKAAWRLLSSSSVHEFSPFRCAPKTELEQEQDEAVAKAIEEHKPMARKARERSPAEYNSGLKFQPIKQRFAGANVFFDLATQEAYSYGWWRFVERIGPYIVFNAYRYSVTTSKHQRNVKSLLKSLGMAPDLTIEAPQGLQNLEAATDYYERRIEKLKAEIGTKGSRKDKNTERRNEISTLQIKIATVSMLQALRDKEDAQYTARWAHK